MLPEGWNIIPLEALALVERGRFSVRPRNDPRYYGGKMPFVQTGDISSSECYLNSYSQTLNDAGVNVSKVFEKNAILMTIAANIGDSAITQFAVACPDSVVGIQPYTDKANVVWLKYTLDTFKESLSNQAGKNAQKNINLQVLKPLAIPTPPLAEQKKIAEILSTWDEAISVVDKQLENCRQQKKALMQQLLTGKKRLPGVSGEWKKTKLSSFCKRITERNNGHCSLVATISAQYGLIRQEEFFNKSVASETLDNYFLLRKGDFAYNKSYSLGYPMGAIKRLNRYQEAVVTSLYICFRLDETKADSDYFEFFFDSGLLDKSLTQIAAEGGRAHGLLNVRPDDFMGIQILFPPLEEQKAIASVLSTSARQIEMLEQKLNALQEEKKSLMQQLLTGKKRVAV